MKTEHIRVRFAPSPTGFMHLGNVRAALINFLFAKQKQGDFILRIEDTDATRNVDPRGTHIIEDLNWLNLNYSEGPVIGGSHGPYYQSERSSLYQKHLDALQAKNCVYKCFCTVEELEKKRQRQLALKQPPRYDRACLRLTESEIQEKIAQQIPYIWRFKLDETKTITFFDLARKLVQFDLKNFSDFALTRQDHSFTFIFANFVDDLLMRITHVFRGEDHLTNTANQVALYQAFDAHIPIFWHLPIMCNIEGKKLSKRDFGFSLTDLRTAGFLPEAICNYLAIIGGGVFEQEIMTLDQTACALNFDAIASTGQIKYDLEKLRWVNHQWIKQYPTAALVALCKPYLLAAYPTAAQLTTEQLTLLIKSIQLELVTLADCVPALAFYFSQPEITPELRQEYYITKHQQIIPELVQIITNNITDPDKATHEIQAFCRARQLNMKEIYTILRVALTSKPQGASIKDLLWMLGSQESQLRLEKLLK
jgi:nondiscriminating glutamyl-tRNA synthetase